MSLLVCMLAGAGGLEASPPADRPQLPVERLLARAGAEYRDALTAHAVGIGMATRARMAELGDRPPPPPDAMLRPDLPRHVAIGLVRGAVDRVPLLERARAFIDGVTTVELRPGAGGGTGSPPLKARAVLPLGAPPAIEMSRGTLLSRLSYVPGSGAMQLDLEAPLSAESALSVTVSGDEELQRLWASVSVALP